jgi:hypothetical protein
MIHLAIQVGVYRHRIACVSDSFEQAKDAARVAIEAEPDDYHAFEVHSFFLGFGEVAEKDSLRGKWVRKDKAHYERNETMFGSRRVIDSMTIKWVNAQPSA